MSHAEPRRPRVVVHCVLRYERKALLIRAEDRTGRVIWRAPGGGVEWGETAEAACRREIREELGVELTSLRFLAALDGIVNWNGIDEHETVLLYDGVPVDWGPLLDPGLRCFEANGKPLDVRWMDAEQPLGAGEAFFPAGLESHLGWRGIPRIRPIVLCAFEHGGRYLVTESYDRLRDFRFRRFPGGGIEFGERAEEALIREMREELDTGLGEVRRLGILENHFEHEGFRGHEVVFVFSATATNPAVYAAEELILTEEHETVRCRWIARSDLNDGARFVPEGVLDLLP